MINLSVMTGGHFKGIHARVKFAYETNDITYTLRNGMTCLFYHPFKGFPLERISHLCHIFSPTHYP